MQSFFHPVCVTVCVRACVFGTGKRYGVCRLFSVMHAVNIKWLDGSDLMFVQKRMWNQCRPRRQRAFSVRGMCFHAEAARCTNTSNFMTKASSSLVSWTGRVLGWDRDSGMINNCTVEPLSLTFFTPSVLNSLPASLWNLPVLSGFKAQIKTFLLGDSAKLVC